MDRPNPLVRSLRARELAGDGRAGSFARTKARRAQRAFIRSRWLPLTVAWLILVAPVPLLWWFLPDEFLRGVLAGTSLTGATAAVWFLVVQSTGTAPIMMGDQAEQWTAQELRKLGRDWRVVNRFALSYGDLDHVAVGPAGILVIETKWSAHPWQSSDGVERQRAAVAQVERVTRQLRLWTEIKRSSVRVRPVVVLWGGGGWDDSDGVRCVDGVAVIEGHALGDWVRSLETDPSSDRATIQVVWDVLDAQVRRREAHDPAAATIPLSVGDVLLRLGTFVMAAVIGFIAVATLLSETGSWEITVLGGVALSAFLGWVFHRWKAVRIPAVGALVGAALPTLILAGAPFVSLIA